MIVSFYSFKGGVGRSHTLVETAAQLARRGRSVLVWDLDLEAPGLQRLPALSSLDERLTLGTVDLLLEMQASENDFPEESLQNAIVDLDHPAVRKAGGRLAFLLPGRLDEAEGKPSYAKKFADVRWEKLFTGQAAAGPAFFKRVARNLAGRFDYVLVDSRTGYTDLSAICTLELPDYVVLVFNLNEQNVHGIGPVWTAVTRKQETGERAGQTVRVFAVANMVPEEPRDRRDAKLARLRERPALVVPLRPARLLTDAIPSLDGPEAEIADLRPLAEAIEIERRSREEAREAEAREKRTRARSRDELGQLGHSAFEREKTFEEQVADLFRLMGHDVEPIGGASGDLGFDLRVEVAGPPRVSTLVECKDASEPLSGPAVEDFARTAAAFRIRDRRNYQVMLVSRSGFTPRAVEAAESAFVELRTLDELARSLVDLGPSLEHSIRDFEGSPLERLYVEQDVVFETAPGGSVSERKPLLAEVRAWRDRPGETFLTLLGDFGSGKTSFSRRLAWELAREARKGGRAPVLVDFKEARSATASLESVLGQHFVNLGCRPLNTRALLHLNREGHLLLIFDGFDEVIGWAEPGQLRENLRQVLRAAEGKAKVLLTCRTHYFRNRPEEKRAIGTGAEVVSTRGATQLYDEIKDRPGARVAYLCEFTEDQVQSYLQKALPPPEDWRAFRDEIRRRHQVDTLAERPFLLEMIVQALPRLIARGAQAISISDLYETFCQRWFDRAGPQLRLTHKHKADLVEYLAQLVWESPENRVHYDVLADKAAEFFIAMDQPLTPFQREQIDYEVRTALFLNRDAGGYYSFIHRSFLEFFLARRIRHGLAAGDADVLDLRRLTPEVAGFLQPWPEAESIIPLARRVLGAAYRARVSENALLLAYWQAASAKPGSELVDPFSGERPAEVHLEGADLSAASLPRIDLSGAFLDQARLAGANLGAARLDQARMHGADLSSSVLRGASLRGAVLEEGGLTRVDARKATFRGADLNQAKLTFARLRGANLSETQATGTEWLGAGLMGATIAVVPPAIGVGAPSPPELPVCLHVGHRDSVSAVAWHPALPILATGGDDGSVKVWDAGSGQLVRTLDGQQGLVFSVSWDARGERLATGGSDGSVKVWNAGSGHILRTLAGHRGRVFSVSWDARGERLATGGSDGSVKVWNAGSGQLVRTLDAHEGWVNSVSWDTRGERLAAGGSDGSMKVWDAGSGQLIRTLAGHEGWVNSVSWDARGGRLATGGDDGSVKVWDAGTGQLVRTLDGQQGRVLSVSWDALGERLATGGLDGSVKVWDAGSGQLVRTLAAHQDWVRSVSWDARGEQLATGGDDGSVKVWDAGSGQLICSLEGQQGAVLSVSWDARGERLAVGFSSGATVIVDVSTMTVLAELHGFSEGGVAITPDGSVCGDPAALAAYVRFADGWALYDIEDVPERVSPERVAASLQSYGRSPEPPSAPR
jgi:WD40 repeat protein/cellulose biosynthesis protein BcsQ